MYSTTLVFLTIFTLLQSSLAALHRPSGQKDLRDLYKECVAGKTNETNILCRGVFGQNCVNGSYCDYFGVVKEDGDEFQYTNVDLDDFGYHDVNGTFKNPGHKGFGYIIAFAPYINIGGNATAACKPEITLKDFKFFVYNYTNERRKDSAWHEESFNWDTGRDSGTAIKKSLWAASCQKNLKDRNYYTNQYQGREITEYLNALLVVDGEYMQFLRVNGYNSYEKKIQTKVASNYITTDGVLYTNFPNEDLPLEERVYQIRPEKLRNDNAGSKATLGSAANFFLACGLLLLNCFSIY